MGHNHHRHTRFGQRPHNVEHFTHQFRIKCGGRLIEQHDLRLHGKGTGDGHTLLLTAGKLCRIVVKTLPHADAFQFLNGQLAGLLLAHVLDADRRLHHVFERGHMRKQIEPLEHHAQLGTLHGHFLVIQGLQHLPTALVDILVADHLAVDVDFAAGQRLKLIDQAQESGFAGTGRTQNHGHGSRHYGHVNAFEHVQAAEGLMYLRGLHCRNDTINRCFSHCHSLTRSCQRTWLRSAC